MATEHLTEAEKTIHAMDREAGITLNRIFLIARVAECTLTPERWSEIVRQSPATQKRRVSIR